MLNERWQLGLPECLGLQPRSCVRDAAGSRPGPAQPSGSQRPHSRVPMENSFPACLLLHAPWKNPMGSSLRSQEDVGVS